MVVGLREYATSPTQLSCRIRSTEFLTWKPPPLTQREDWVVAVSRQALAAHEAEESPVSGCGGSWVPFCHKEGRIGGPSMNRGNQRFTGGGWWSTDDGWRLAGQCTRCRGGGVPGAERRTERAPTRPVATHFAQCPTKSIMPVPKAPLVGSTSFHVGTHTHTIP